MAEREEVPFTFSWVALRLLGSGLYSNPWSALSELVANGFDAGARTVSVHLDIRRKDKATVELFDDGEGMDRAGIQTYAVVGHDKRTDAENADPNTLMGRKGIGKLAALYLSDHFHIRTRTADSDTTWVLDAQRAGTEGDHPSLVRVESMAPSTNLERWEEARSGTFIRLDNVDLGGNGVKAFEAFASRLANQFELSNSSLDRKILVRIFDGDDSAEYKSAQKNIAFKNFAFVERTDPALYMPPAGLPSGSTSIRIPAPGLDGDIYVHKPGVAAMSGYSVDDKFNATDVPGLNLDERTYRGIGYALRGWVGIHATIDSESAKINDDRFVKNRYYNPAQLRLYVHGKLASDRLLAQLGLTGTYLNYIEGELVFDILDDDALPDIATSNRQDFDETDPRIALLRALVRPVVRRLMSRRQELAKKITALQKAAREEQNSRGKEVFSKQLSADLENYPEIPSNTRDEIHNIATAKLAGDVTPKSDFRVFLSHASGDDLFTNFVYFLLKHHRVSDDEIFYTSRPNSVIQYGDYRQLSSVIRSNIRDNNTLICYLTSKNFAASEYCLFEGGAGWATRGVSKYLKLNVDFNSIPAFLTNGKLEKTLLQERKIELTGATYKYLIEFILNPIIAHLNEGRLIKGADLLESFAEVTFPDPLELSEAGETEEDYFDDVIVRHWRVYVEEKLDSYLEDYFAEDLQKS
ncbi:ATP-binding protein [Curtobacterium flaccumfaciens pv. flaccumfaciens]|uniref:ATP-binding protein n=1 Tax=Curtobacterium poinsettiae TaxID=159612 RepID=UPI00217E7D76|nr:ATP-binding protein [Curtobacterium flaccumfaciens]MCS6564937.1 ATP-binding protein [Curtobacterium flaccumfaciens pv. flaccumfaciens]